MMRVPAWDRIAVFCAILCLASVRVAAAEQRILQGLAIIPPGASTEIRAGLPEAMRVLHVPSVSIAVIEGDRILFAHAYGGGALARTLYQAASLSKTVTAVAALRLVQGGRLALDRNVDADLRTWRMPETASTRDHPVTLRGLLSMTAGTGVPGYAGYPRGAILPDLVQILNGAPPAQSSAVRVEHVPGSRFAYSGGGYEIVRALVQDAAHLPFAGAAARFVLRPARMTQSFFGPPPSSALDRVARGHDATGAPLPGGWRDIPELAAGGMWSTPTDLARFLIGISLAWKGQDERLLNQAMAREMLTRQNGGPYGLGAAVGGAGRDLALLKRGQNPGYQNYMLIFPETGQGMVVMTGSDNGTRLVTALIHRAAAVLRWPHLGDLPDFKGGQEAAQLAPIAHEGGIADSMVTIFGVSMPAIVAALTAHYERSRGAAGHFRAAPGDQCAAQPRARRSAGGAGE